MKTNKDESLPIISFLGENPDTECGGADVIDPIHGAGKFIGVQVIDGPLRYGKVEFDSGDTFLGDFDEEDSSLRFGTFIYKDGKVVSGVFEDGVLQTGTVQFPNGSVVYMRERFEDGTFDGAMFEINGDWTQGTYKADTFELVYGARYRKEEK